MASSSRSKPVLRPLQTISLRKQKKSSSNQANAQHLVGQQFLTASNVYPVGVYKLREHEQESIEADSVTPAGVPVITVSECEEDPPTEQSRKSQEEVEAALCSRLQAMYQC